MEECRPAPPPESPRPSLPSVADIKAQIQVAAQQGGGRFDLAQANADAVRAGVEAAMQGHLSPATLVEIYEPSNRGQHTS